MTPINLSFTPSTTPTPRPTTEIQKPTPAQIQEYIEFHTRQVAFLQQVQQAHAQPTTVAMSQGNITTPPYIPTAPPHPQEFYQGQTTPEETNHEKNPREQNPKEGQGILAGHKAPEGPKKKPKRVEIEESVHSSGAESPKKKKLEQEITERVRTEMEKFRRKEPRNTSFLNIGNPLSTEIREENFLLNYKTPQLDDYNGTGDPVTNLSCFQVVMMVQSLSEAAVCKLFPTTLNGPAAIWYQSLKEGSIRSFDELAKAFRTHFAPSIQRKKKSSDLKFCYQKPGESLQSYIARFNAEAVEVGNLNDDTVIDAMKDNTTMMAFRDNLITNPVQTYS
ncbi:uncharacterized protein LOC126681719 [Mercurialis annua]|uniref:uncharacterized protein LOC126681719 n=1 Tax=Mercurialis annua TaxID=3986 RepID=UPI002160271B|nr:uncharacterized protein LOC126681719 [Mercurialis annua]